MRISAGGCLQEQSRPFSIHVCHELTHPDRQSPKKYGGFGCCQTPVTISKPGRCCRSLDCGSICLGHYFWNFLPPGCCSVSTWEFPPWTLIIANHSCRYGDSPFTRISIIIYWIRIKYFVMIFCQIWSSCDQLGC